MVETMVAEETMGDKDPVTGDVFDMHMQSCTQKMEALTKWNADLKQEMSDLREASETNYHELHEKIADLRVQMAHQAAYVSIIVGVLSAVGSALLGRIL